ncbi:MAG: rod shape-determining protein RodA [Rhodobacteraceae bacterium]|jgi:cell elongation-specific peptidoglycan biosynthesis regulator RodA|uniref:Peptidoglycan glycosyltransferase MrdB n=1 Tax=Thioclava marina TaxID=1915077 RepID=A0ABX3MJ56_9RHOB|nr:MULTISPECIES: rod shape-determining protein RodA [Thioclava]OOY11577.1 rod shape-determining protein RodA [Thioclava marina]OOY27406.1 rod shape-determining protein RodA [Thioclava sp. L04-15]TNE83500.1 MAG: rod shape-determining protein RodA [Paracoccaceae bacterium]TNF10414.1 MAG: rod shape-determining protein RodA [Paracoccaceae bacterium]
MSYLESNLKTVPVGWRKILYMNWPLVILLTAVACAGFLMLYSVAGGNLRTWAEPQMKRFALGMVAMFTVAFVPIWFWRNVSAAAYFVALLLLVAVEFFGAIGMGAQRWLEIGPLRIQPSELMKITLVMLLAAYYDWLPVEKVSRPLWVFIPAVIILTPTFLVLAQPDLGTAVMLVLGGAFVMFAAGVSLWYFGTVLALVVALVFGVMESRGTEYQLLHDYQYKRIDTFLDPGSDPLGAGYNIMQAQIALGSGGWSGRGFMQGTQSRLNFLPEKHTDFIFTTLAEEFGFVGAFSLLMLYAGIIGFALYTAMATKDRFASLLSFGVAGTFFFFFAINMAMVMGLMPVVGVPLPLVSYGGTAMMILLAAFGLVQSAHIHRPRQR